MKIRFCKKYLNGDKLYFEKKKQLPRQQLHTAKSKGIGL